MPYEIRINGFPHVAPNNEAAAIKAGEKEAAKYNHVEVQWVNSTKTGQKTSLKLIKRWKNGREVR